MTRTEKVLCLYLLQCCKGPDSIQDWGAYTDYSDVIRVAKKWANDSRPIASTWNQFRMAEVTTYTI